MRHIKRYLFLVIMIFTPSISSYAGVTGTLAGRVIDAGNKKPLPGANIIISGTYIGAATDRDGYYLVNNIPAGKYDVRAEMIGYNKMVQKNVVILMDLRTTLNFEMESTVLNMQEVIVTAEAPMIKRDVTATTHFIARQEIEQLPVLSFKEIVDIQPGVAAGHIRGGRQSEVLYLVDGFPIQEAVEGDVGSELPMSSIIDMTVQTGGFNAEYGNAMSGVVNIITQNGGDRLGGLFELSALNYSVFSNPFGDRADEYDWITELNFGGPVFNDNYKFFISSDLRIPNTRWKREEFGQRLMIYNDEDSYNTNLNGKITMLPSKSFKLTFQSLLSIWNWREYDHEWKKNLVGLPERSKKSYRLGLTAVHTLNPKTFYEIRLNQYNVLKSILGASSIEQAAVRYENNDPTSWVISGDYPWWLDHAEVHNTVKLDLTSQITMNHQVKSGAEITIYDLHKKSVQRMEIETIDPQFPQYITYDIEYDYRPIRGAFYVQDKIEYEGMIANIGLRYDFFDPKAYRPALEEALMGDRSTWIIDYDKEVKASVKNQFSPRVGVALPIAPDKELHINYGYFFQMPLFDYLYTNSNLNPAEGFAPLGDPDLKPAKTLSYEVSYKHLIDEDMLIDFTIFNKEVSNLVDNNTYFNEGKSAVSGTGYYRYVNLEKVNIWGSEIFLKRRVGKFLSGKVSYTYMVAKGTGSENTQKFSWLTKDTVVPISEYYLSWDQRHTLVINFDVRKSSNWGINLLWRWNSPLPYTKYQGILTEPNNARMDVVTSFDVRLNKDFNILGNNLNFYTEFINIFDHENILWMNHNGVAGGYYEDPSAWDGRFQWRIGLNSRF
ncbi:TonB-dependent receptor [candidate division KSB1 bacterium]|nr:TonB-dependent receptor [candidate division KSB1 bacterium]